ncbi:MAG: four helix bundle protein [Chitinophagaceae bacterium]|nr:four helix bundle protein [Chitinophagaceae bacterium]MBP9104084.1 four helix bundle protein [Chitinophagaceae bacterium]
MTKAQLRERFKQYAIVVARFVLKLPYNVVNKNYADQLNRSASSSAANYSASLRAKSSADFINKFKIVEEELDESLFFFELVEANNPTLSEEIKILSKEGNELLSIIVSSLKTLRLKHNKNRNS